MLKLIANNSYGVAEYIASTDADLADLPKDGLVGQGSTCFYPLLRAYLPVPN